jgi:hypothetical protein
MEILLAEVALALRAVDRMLGRVLDQLENELALALRALEDLGQHVDPNLMIVTRPASPPVRNATGM